MAKPIPATAPKVLVKSADNRWGTPTDLGNLIAPGVNTLSIDPVSGKFVGNAVDGIVVTANLPGNTSVPRNTPTFLVNWATQTNTSGAAWNPATGIFTVPRAGNYTILLRIMYAMAAWTAGQEANVTIRKGTAVLTTGPEFARVTANQFMITGLGFTTQQFDVGDQVRFAAFHQAGGTRVTHAAQFSSLSITEIR